MADIAPDFACKSIDFMSDSLMDGKAIRTMNILDDYNRDVLWIEVRHSFPAEQMTRILDRVAEWRGYPKQIRATMDWNSSSITPSNEPRTMASSGYSFSP